MDINNSLIERIGLPVLVVDRFGEIIYKNKHIESLFEKLFNDKFISKIVNVDKEFDFNSISFGKTYIKTILLNKLKVKTYIYKTKYNGGEQVLVYILDNILFNKEVINILNHIGDIIDITNEEGIVETINDAAYKLIGCDKNDIRIGTSLLDLHGTKILSEPAFCSVVRERKPVVKRIRYDTGVTLLNRGYPVFSEEGHLEKVIIFGQDISKLTALQERVILSEEKNKLALAFDETDRFFKENNLVFASDTIKKIVNTAIKIAPTDSSVFIWGESGVGKEMITKIIHNTSARKNKPFIDINCAAIPHHLLEAELFGYEQGAFTGASKFGKKGLFEEANGGTIFLDEIGEMPYDMQSKLLRVIQENKIRRVGGNEDIPINVRYISATNLNINDEINKDRFRSDLYYRLCEIPIYIPPLRDRKEDIVVLIKHFMDLFNKQYNRSVSLSNTVVKKLINYSWPGNVRELRNVIQRLILLSDDNFINDINLDDYGLNITNTEELHDCSSNNDDIIINNILPLKKAINIVENKLINKVYSETKSIVKTAEVLEIDPSTIHRKINKGEVVIID